MSGGTSQDGVTDLSTSQVNLITPRIGQYNLYIISTEDALRRPLTYDDHPIQSKAWMESLGVNAVWVGTLDGGLLNASLCAGGSPSK